MKQNNSGMSMILVIAALLATGFIGSSLLKMAMADRLSGIHFSSSESARSAAKSGITAALVRIGSSKQETKDSILAILNNYIKTPNPDTLSNATNFKKIWINGGPNSAPTNQQWQSLASGSAEKFRTRIDAFNRTTFEITLVSEGIGAGGSKSSAIGVYRLTNLGFTTSSSNAPVNALQMDNGNFEFNCNLTVNGNTSIKDTFAINTGPARFNGKLRLDSITLSNGSKRAGRVRMAANIQFDSTVYLAGGIAENGGTQTFLQSVGFGGKVTAGNTSSLQFTSGKSVYFNGGYTSSDDAYMDMNAAKLFAYGTTSDFYKSSTTKTNMTLFTNKGTGSISSLAGTKYDIPTQLGIPIEPDPAILFNTALIDKIAKVESAARWGNKITSDTLNAWYKSAKDSSMLWKDRFLVVRFDQTSGGDIYPFAAGTTPFNRKVILLINNSSVRLSSFFETQMDSGLTCIFLNSYNSNAPIFVGLSNFRGFMYVKSNPQQMVIQSSKVTNFKGALYYSKDALAKFDSGIYTITWDKSVIDSLAVTNIFSDPTVTSSALLKITGSRIIPMILSHAM